MVDFESVFTVSSVSSASCIISPAANRAFAFRHLLASYTAEQSRHVLRLESLFIMDSSLESTSRAKSMSVKPGQGFRPALLFSGTRPGYIRFLQSSSSSLSFHDAHHHFVRHQVARVHIFFSLQAPFWFPGL